MNAPKKKSIAEDSIFSRRSETTSSSSVSRGLYVVDKRKSEVIDRNNKQMRNDNLHQLYSPSPFPVETADQFVSQTINRTLHAPKKSLLDDAPSDLGTSDDKTNVRSKCFIERVISSCGIGIDKMETNTRLLFAPPQKPPPLKSHPKHKQQGPSKPTAGPSGFVPASKITSHFPAVTSKQEELQNFIANEGITLPLPGLNNLLRTAFYPWHIDRSILQMTLLQTEFNVSSEVLKTLVYVINSCKIVDKLMAKIGDIQKFEEFSFFCGISTRNFLERFKEHRLWHGCLYGDVLTESGSLEDAALAEFTAIIKLKDLEATTAIKGCWNVSPGYDSPALIEAANDVDKFVLYLMCNRLKRSTEMLAG
jgi:hypothetical protein